MNSHYYAQRLLERLPRVLQGGANIDTLFEILGQEMVHMDRGASLLIRSRWHGLARGWDDRTMGPAFKKATELGRLGVLLGLVPGHDESARQFRRRMLDFIRIHRNGLGSAPAILRLAALVYRAVNTPEISWEENDSANNQEYMKEYMAVAKFKVMDHKGDERTLRLELMDNPSKSTYTTFENITSDTEKELIITNSGLYGAAPRIELFAKDTTVLAPMLEHLETGRRALFVGRIPKGTKLSLAAGSQPLIDGLRDHTGELLLGRGFVYGQARFYSPPDTPQLAARFASFESENKFPVMGPGENHWRYLNLSREALEGYLVEKDEDKRKSMLEKYDRWMREKCDAPGMKKNGVDLSFFWQERIPAAFTLRIPADYCPPFMENLGELERGLNRALEYGRVAGVNARLEITARFTEETLNVEDSLGIRASAGFFESQNVQEQQPPSTARIKMAEQVDLDDRFGVSGVFDNSSLDYSTFTTSDPKCSQERGEDETCS